MLFPYQYVPHQMERMQRFINFIFYQVWCRAPKTKAYSLVLFDAHPPLKAVMESFAYDHTKEGDRFSSRIQEIYESFAKLPRADIAKLKCWYQSNNDIERACGNAPGSQITRYVEIQEMYPKLSELLASFFKNLYLSDLLGLKALRDKIGDIDDHYQTFVKTNKAGKCPFCGISDLFGEYHSKREAYDHYLPKKLYPFNSINFRNLVPACHHCNSSYKTSKDPAYNPKDPVGAVQRRKVFYPFAGTSYEIELQVTLQHSDIKNLTSEDVSLQFGPPAISEEIDTWKDVYGIEERYKAKFCGENDGKYWLMQVLDEWKAGGRLPADFLNNIAQQATLWPYAECNFLKKPFLDAYKQLGIFDVNQNTV
jgi:hypothetical protein